MLHTAVLAATFGCKSQVEIEEPADPRAYFDRYVAPELERRCATSGCHAVPIETYRARGAGWYKLAVDPDGQLRSREALDIAYAESTGTAPIGDDADDNPGTVDLMRKAASHRIDRHAAPIFSDLVRKVIPESLGGVPHRGGDNYVTMRDPALGRLMAWIEAEHEPEPPALTPLLAQFAAEVLPALSRRGCMVASCHGPLVASIFKLELGVAGAFSDQMIRDNYKAARAFINVSATRPDDSRLLAKALPPELGGILHRGSNRFFSGDDDPDLDRIRRWIRAEQAAAALDPRPRGVVYVRRPPSERDAFDVGAWTPGADLWLLAPVAPDGARTNLTAAHRDGPADVRTPEVSPDGQEILFAMRRSADDCLNIYRIGVDGAGLRQLTRDGGCREASFGPNHVNKANLSPLYGPDGRIYFISTRAGVLADKGRYPATHIWSMDPDGGGLEQVTYSHGHEVDLSMATKSGKAIMLITSLRDISLERHGALYFVPPGWWTDYHPFFGEQSKYPIFAQSHELPDYRTIVSLQHWDNRYQGGALAIFDRNLGPDIEDPSERSRAALPAFVPAMTVMTPDGVALGVGRGPLWRDPAALPDGRIVVSTSTTPVDPNAAGAPVDFDLVVAQVLTSTRTREPFLGPTEVVAGDRGWWEVEAAVVAPRELPHLGKSYLRSNLPPDTGLIQYYDAYTLETILRDNRPFARGAMVIPQIAGLRMVVGAPLTPADASPLDPALVRNGDPASTRVSNGIHGRRYSIGPVPVERDGSIYFRMPATTPFFQQMVDHDGLAIGVHYDRWLFLTDGEAFGNGVSTHTYDMVCGGCHGSYDGAPERAFAGFDAITSASVTMATHSDPETRKAPVDSTAPEWRHDVSFKSDLQPVLDTKCATSGCHDVRTAAGDLDLSADAGGTYRGPWSNGYESLMKLGDGSGSARAGPWRKEYVDEREMRARRSYLVEKILDRELDAPRQLTRGGCRAASVLEADEKSDIALWIDTGATYLSWKDGR